jgi:hypothetical protein
MGWHSIDAIVTLIDIAPVDLEWWATGHIASLKVGVLCVLHLGISSTGIQEQSVEQFFFLVQSRKYRLEFLLGVGLRRLLCIVEFRQDFAGNEDVPCPQGGILCLQRHCELCDHQDHSYDLIGTSHSAEVACDRFGTGNAGCSAQ